MLLAHTYSTNASGRVNARSAIRKTGGHGIQDVMSPLTFPTLKEKPAIVVAAKRQDISEMECIEVCRLSAELHSKLTLF